MKVGKTITARRKYAGMLRRLAPNFSYCSCCGTPWRFVDGKSMDYEKGRGFFPLCEWCFYDPSVSFEDLVIYHSRDDDQHKFTEEQIEYVTNSLIKESEENDIIKVKYVEYLNIRREKQIDKIVK